jgi:hypothetical protein
VADDLPFQRNLSGRNESLRIEIPEGRIHGGDPGHRFKETGVSRSSTPEDFIQRKQRLRVETPEGRKVQNQPQSLI